MEISDREAIESTFARLRSVLDDVGRLKFHALTAPERLALLDELEFERRRQPAVEHQLIHGLVSESTPGAVGATSWSDALQQRLRISAAEAKRRLNDAADLGPRTALTGEALEPKLGHLAKRQAGGEVGAEHIRIIRKFFDDLPAAVDYQTRECCEETLARLAAEHTPEALRKAADRLAAYLNPDGDFSDVDRAQKRGF
ncbi:DUF222 domain-containing protein, partial [Mycobacterium sp. E740]|uniref:DUF222 domain-containing protein n=1 Tax=Mycobacterium sp. E740 TaxID=1834149 RepID=UPI000A54430E